MNLVKWLRKNNRKVMAVVVVLIMIAFVLGTALQQLARRMGNRIDDAVYTIDGGQISRLDINSAEAQLNVLTALNQPVGLLGLNQQGRVTQRNIGWLLLCQTLFPEVSANFNLNTKVKTLARQNQLGISQAQIDKFFNQTSTNPQMNWLLLKNEAKKYGITVLPSQAEEMVKMQKAQNRVATLAKNAGLTSQQVYQTLADFDAVRLLVNFMCTSDNTTISQIRNLISATRETFDYEFVRFPADLFVDQVPEPTRQQIKQHFEKYKELVPGDISKDNPFGFGYRLPDRVKIEYVLIDRENIEKLIEEVTEQQAEQFYQQHLSQLTRQVPIDPNDPNSPMTEQTMRYSQVANLIKRRIKQEKISAKAEEIITSIKETAMASYGTSKPGQADVNEIAKKADSYSSIAKQAKEKFNIDINAGTTSYVSAVDLGSKSVLGNMALLRGQKSAVSLIKLIFAIPQLSDVELYGIEKPNLYENIGMLSDGRGQKVGLVRVIDYKKAQPPESLDLKVQKDMPLAEDAEAEEFTIKEKVIENIKLEQAFEIAKEKAQQFAKQIKNNNWQKTLDTYNEKFNLSDANDSQLIIDKMTGRNRVLQRDVEIAKMMSQGQSFAQAYRKQAENIKKLLDEIYTLTEDQLPAVIDVKADGGVYVIKDVTINKLNVDEYKQAKTQMTMALEDQTMQSGAIIYLMPENLRERMNFKPVETDSPSQDPEDANNTDANEANKA